VHPAYAVPCVPLGHELVTRDNGPLDAVTVTFVVDVADPAAFVAVSVYVVVAVGFTLVEPLALEDVNVPGVIAIVVAPVVVQLNVLLAPAAILVGFALNELIVGLLAAATVTLAVAVTAPAAFVAVSVYVVLAVGFTLVEPLALEDVNVPGVIATVVAPVVVQLNALLAPAAMLVGFALNALIVGLLAAATVTVAVEVTAPAAFVAVSVYVVLAVGFTLVDPLALEDVNVPGVIATVVAPVVVQLNVLLAPAAMLVGFALNALIVGLLAAFTVTVIVVVDDPAAFVAVNV
jgi:hypothetical protein